MNSPRQAWCISFALVACALALAGGCGPAGIVTHPVSGSVTFDGQPVTEGEIIFRVIDNAQGSYAAKIHDGRYELRSTAGAKRVEITAYRTVETAAAPSGEGATNRQMYLPAKYNEQSQLTAEVTAAGPNQFDFALTP